MKKTRAPLLQLDQFVPYRLSMTANAVSKVIASAYEARFGLTIPEWRLMAVLNEIQIGTQQDLVHRTLMDKVAVSRAAAALVARGLVRKGFDPADGRARRLTLSPAGLSLYREIAPLAVQYEQALLSELSPAEIRTLTNLLARVEQAAAKMANKVNI